MKVRIDKLLVDRGLAQSRNRAQALVLAGKVLADGQKVEKPGATVSSGAVLRLLGDDLRYVSRGGLKLEAALRHWNIEIAGHTCLDIGASTGGFTDCLLQHGAARVIAIDTGYGQLDYRLRQDPRVCLLEKTNARFLRPEVLEAALEGSPGVLAGQPSRNAGVFAGRRGVPASTSGTTASVPAAITLVAVDVSFISATLVLPAVLTAAFQKGAKGPCDVIVLVKPQFEAGREHVGKGGIVRDPAAQQAAVEKVRRCLVDLGANSTDVVDSPILGMEGNREFLLYARFLA